MKSQITARALDLGFDLCGVTSAHPPATAPALARWLAEGRQAGMDYLQRNAERRMDPRKVLPGARSIVVLAASYDLADPSTPPGPAPPSLPGGQVARYARFSDYHQVMGDRLAILANFMDGLGGPESQSRWYVDTGPLLERDLAQRAGLGFVGKHTNLISRSLGNWFLLGAVLTTLELEPDQPQVNRCGSCRRCLDACPTGALTAPFQLDARLCIAYLTIEHKGPIPEELRPAVGRRVFGCDDCLEACPWNRFASQARLLKPYAKPELASLDLLALLDLDDAAFQDRFRGTPIQRLKRGRLLRNVCVALGNSGDPRAIPALQKAARDPNPLVAEHAAWALERIRA